MGKLLQKNHLLTTMHGQYLLFLSLRFLISGLTVFCICLSTSVEEQVSYGGKVVGESAMVRASDIGNEVKHKYFVSSF